MLIDELKNKVLTVLVTTHDISFEEAEGLINDSMENEEDRWDDEADPDDLAKYLANGDDED